ncbi:RNase H family protein [Rhizobium sp. BR 315]|uniref:RNase H family protein n=1 Tax=Rhizobium sp. BR 315 TaxID=3040014 RepID=UPI003D32F4DC
MTDALHTYTDGSFDAASRSGGWAAVVYEGDSQLFAAYGKGISTSNNTFEVLAVLSAMAWIAAEAPARWVTLWTDAAQVIERLLSMEDHMAQQRLAADHAEPRTRDGGRLTTWRSGSDSTPSGTASGCSRGTV